MAALPDLVDRLQAGGSDATASFSQDELETVIDDLPLALESEAMRAALPDLVARIDRRQQRTFRRIIEIARQDEERITLLLAALRRLEWNGSPTEDEFAWLISQLNRIDDPDGPRDAFERMSSLTLHGAQVSMLDALATSHFDADIRKAHAERRNKAPGRELTAEMVEESARRAAASTVAAVEPPPVETPAPAPAPAQPEAEAPMDWGEEKPPERLTVRTLLRSLDPAVNLAGAPRSELPPESSAVAETDPVAAPEPAADWSAIAEPVVDPIADPVAAADGAAVAEPVADPIAEPVAATDWAAVADPAADPVPNPVAEAVPAAAANATDAAAAPAQGDYEVTPPPPPEESVPAAESAAVSEDVWREEPGAETPRVTVRTLLRSLETVRVERPPPIPDEEPAPPPVAESAPAEDDVSAGSVMGMLRSLDTVRVSLKDLEAAKLSLPSEAQAAFPASAVTPGEAPREQGAVAAGQPAQKADAPPSPWSGLDLTAQSPPERARRLSRVRRELTTPVARRHYLTWLLQQENDAAFGPSIRKELLEFAFERPTFLAFDSATRGRLGRWIRERAAAEAVPAAAVLAALRRAMWSDGEPPVIDEEIRPLVDAASGCLMRATADERLPLLGRDFSVWLFAVREIEDREPLDKWARDPQPAVVEGVFRALAAMDALAARIGGTGEGPTALQLALGVWDRADSETRLQMAHGIAAGWSRGFVLDRATFFDAFWRRAKENPVQREPVMIALASFDKELEEARAKDKVLEPKVDVEAQAQAEAKAVPQQPDAAATDPMALAPPPVAVSTTAATASPFAEEAEESVENTTERYFRTKREEIERTMRPPAREAPSVPVPVPLPVPAPMPARAEARVDASAAARMDARVADADDEETEDEQFDAIPDEGDDVLADESIDEDPEVSARRRDKTNPGIRIAPRPLNPPPAAPTKAAASEDEMVLPNEPLRTLGAYTAFLKALSSGSPIDELLDQHGMDYKQYAACMTAWGKVLQNRPELALRMGQLLRS